MAMSSKTTWLRIVLLASLVGAGIFVCQCRQKSGELTKQIELKENFSKQITAKERYAEVLEKARSLHPDARLVEVKNYPFPGNLVGFDLDGKLFENWAYTFIYGNESPIEPDFSKFAFRVEANSKNVFLAKESLAYKIPYRPIPEEKWIIDSDIAIVKANEAGGKEWIEEYGEMQYKEIGYTLQSYDPEYSKSSDRRKRISDNLLIWEISYYPEGDSPPDIKKASPAYIIGVGATTGDILYKSYGAPLTK